MIHSTYDFTLTEMKLLVKFFNESDVPIELNKFVSFVEGTVYKNLTIEEVEQLVHEK